MKQNTIQRENSNCSSAIDSDAEQKQQLISFLLSFKHISHADPIPPPASAPPQQNKEKPISNGQDQSKEQKGANRRSKRVNNGIKKDSESPYRIMVTTDLKTKGKFKVKRPYKGGAPMNFTNLDWDISTAGKPHNLQYQEKSQNGKLDANYQGEKILFQKTLSLTNDTSILRRRRSMLDKRPRFMKAQKKVLGTYSRGSKQFQAKVFTCHLESCGKIFTDRASLKKHLTVHGDKLFQCTFHNCGKKFLDNAKLKRHMLVHTGEKPYECHLCGKKFSLDFNLKTHQRIHTGEKPFSCSFKNCHKRFNQKSNLHAHMLTHHLQDANPDFAQQIQNESLGMQESFPYLDLTNVLSAVSDKNKLTKYEKREQEISKLIQKSGGKLFNVKLERNFSKDDCLFQSDDFSLEKQLLESIWNLKGDKPLFKIMLKSRKGCCVHNTLMEQEQNASDHAKLSNDYSISQQKDTICREYYQQRRSSDKSNSEAQLIMEEGDKTVSEDISLQEEDESDQREGESNNMNI